MNPKKPAHAMPTVPKSVMIGKCPECQDFHRLTDLSGGVCIDKNICRAVRDFKAQFKPKQIPETVPDPTYTINEPCANCDEWTDKRELELSEQHWCQACTVDRGAE